MAAELTSSVATLEQVLSNMERKLREAAMDGHLAAALALKLGATLSCTELHGLAVGISRLAAEVRGQRWTQLEPAAAVPARPEPTVNRDATSVWLQCTGCRVEVLDAAYAVDSEHEGCPGAGVWEVRNA